MSAKDLYDSRYFVSDKAEEPVEEDRKACLLNPSNMKTKFSLDLGFQGSGAFCSAFSDLRCEKGEEIVWQMVAQFFIEAARNFAEGKETSVCPCCLVCLFM